MTWERKVLIVLAVIVSVFLVVTFGAKVLALLGFGAVGSYTYRAHRRVTEARINAEKADKAVERMRRSSDSVKASRKKLDELREILAEKASDGAPIDWDSNASAPPPDSLDD